MGVDGARKGSAFVPEELAFKKAGGDCGAIHLHQTSVPAGAELLNCASGDFLSGARLPPDQNCRIFLRQRFRSREDPTEHPTSSPPFSPQRQPLPLTLPHTHSPNP